MKKYILSIMMLASAFATQAQEAPTKGFLLPRMTTAQKTALVNPAKGLTIYNTDTNAQEINTGTATTPVWSENITSLLGWSTNGNAGTTAGTNFFGTTDNVDVTFKRNSLEYLRFENNYHSELLGSLSVLAVGTVDPYLEVDGTLGSGGFAGISVLDDSYPAFTIKNTTSSSLYRFFMNNDNTNLNLLRKGNLGLAYFRQNGSLVLGSNYDYGTNNMLELNCGAISNGSSYGISIYPTITGTPIRLDLKLKTNTNGVKRFGLDLDSGVAGASATAIERLTIIGETGNTGLSIKSPQYALHVKSGSYSANLNNGIALTSGTIDDNNNTIGFTSIIKSKTDATGNYRLAFDVSSDAIGGSTERLVIRSTGNIGMGTASPTEKLEVAGAIKIGTTSTATPAAGTIRFNTTTNKFEGYDGTAWVAFH